MIKEQITKTAEKHKVSEKVGKQDVSQKKRDSALFQAVPPKTPRLANYKAFIKHLLSDNVDLEPAD